MNEDKEQNIVNPIDPRLPTNAKIDALYALSHHNEQLINDFIIMIDTKYGTSSELNYKTSDKIIEKASRPSIKQDKPWFDIEHIRDCLRFKTVLDDITVLPQIIDAIKSSNFNVIKIDTRKMLNPRLWGWRAVILDLQLPNGQLVEYYLIVKEIEQAKSAGNHQLYEKWRNRRMDKLNETQYIELYTDQEISCSTYMRAWSSYLQRTNQSETLILKILKQVHSILGYTKD
jgi:hypothetical protein